MKKTELYKRAQEAFKELFGDRYDEDRANDCVDKIWDENNPEGSMSRLEAIIGRTEARMRASQNFDSLNFIKSELFNATPEVKSAFNNIVKYFSKGQVPTTVKAYLEGIIFGLSSEKDSLILRLNAPKGKNNRGKGIAHSKVDPELVAKEVEAYDIAIKAIEEALKKVK